VTQRQFALGFCLLGIIFPGKILSQSNLSFPVIREIPSPVDQGALPNLFLDSKGKAWMSWVAYADDSTDVLMHAALGEEGWQSPGEIARGTNWFVNWADFPSLALFPATRGDYFLAHWLQKSAAGIYDYDVRIAVKSAFSDRWSFPGILHSDTLPAEHGFVTLLPEGEGNIRAFWLDGRLTRTGNSGADHGNHGEGGGAMTLRTARVDTLGAVHEETLLDSRICDCCQTASAMLPAGPAVVYRDRSEEEVRDISIIRFEAGQWTKPRRIYADDWQIAACPVNGPAIAARGNRLAIAWYAGKHGEVKLIFSSDGGKSFRKPLKIDGAQPTGRVDLAWMESGEVVVSWVGQEQGKTFIKLRTAKATGSMGRIVAVKEIDASRLSGFPHILPWKNGVLLAATEVGVERKTTVKTYWISYEIGGPD